MEFGVQWGLTARGEANTSARGLSPKVAIGISAHRRFPFGDGESVPKQNYHHARKQKELARKARQQEKQQRRATRQGGVGETGEPGPEATASEPAARTET